MLQPAGPRAESKFIPRKVEKNSPGRVRCLRRGEWKIRAVAPCTAIDVDNGTGNVFKAMMEEGGWQEGVCRALVIN